MVSSEVCDPWKFYFFINRLPSTMPADKIPHDLCLFPHLDTTGKWAHLRLSVPFQFVAVSADMHIFLGQYENISTLSLFVFFFLLLFINRYLPTLKKNSKLNSPCLLFAVSWSVGLNNLLVCRKGVHVLFGNYEPNWGCVSLKIIWKKSNWKYHY